MKEERKIETEKLREAAAPLIKLLNTNYHPHVTVIITPTSIELLEGRCSIPNIHEFLID